MYGKPVSSIHSLEIVSECKRVLRKDGTLVVGFAAPAESAVQSAEQIGYVEDRCQHWDRMVDIWEAGFDYERQASLVAGWTGNSMDEAKCVVRENWKTLASIVQACSEVSAHLNVRGIDGRKHLRKVVTFSQQLFTEVEVQEFVIQYLGLRIHRLIRSVSGWSITVAVKVG